MERSISTRPRRGDARRRDATRRDTDASDRVGSGRVAAVVATAISEWVYRYHCRDRSAARYARIPLRANARPYVPVSFSLRSRPAPSERASERFFSPSLSAPSSPSPSPPPPRVSSSLPPSLSLILFSSVAPSIAAESYGLTRSYDFSGRVLGHLFSYLEKRPLSTIRRRFRVRARARRERKERRARTLRTRRVAMRRDRDRDPRRRRQKEEVSREREERKREGGSESGTRGS